MASRGERGFGARRELDKVVLRSGVSIPSEAVDVVLVGGGIAGLAAALAAAEEGARTVLLEKASMPERGGNTRFADAQMRFPHRADEYGARTFYSATSGHFGPEVTEQLARDKVATVASALRYENTNSDNIDLWTRSGMKLILPTNKGLLIDFHAITDILSDFFKPLAKMSGEVGRLKGEDFEGEVALAVGNEVPGAQVIWRGKKVARATPQERELDLGVIKDDTLFILECKAHALAPAFDKGEPDALEKRRFLNAEALRQADSLAQFLAANPKGKDYEVPEDVSFIVSAAISPFPEYIHERSERFFLSERLPRVCTPEEIVNFMKQFRAADYVGKLWFLEVQRPPGLFNRKKDDS